MRVPTSASYARLAERRPHARPLIQHLDRFASFRVYVAPHPFDDAAVGPAQREGHYQHGAVDRQAQVASNQGRRTRDTCSSPYCLDVESLGLQNGEHPLPPQLHLRVSLANLRQLCVLTDEMRFTPVDPQAMAL